MTFLFSFREWSELIQQCVEKVQSYNNLTTTTIHGVEFTGNLHNSVVMFFTN